MNYRQASIEVDVREADLLTDALMEVGALSVAIEDAYAGTEAEEPVFGEPGMDQKLWPHSLILALFDAHAPLEALIQAACDKAGVALPDYHVVDIPDTDWVSLTQAQFDPIPISDRLWITPTWHESPAPEAINIRLDPGLAFGTGSHPTTKLCLKWLDESMRLGKRVLDYGCGSGILAIAAMKLGAVQAIGIDVDENALIASRQNALQNGVDAQFYLPHEAEQLGKFDVVLANILANPLRLLGPMLAQYTQKGGVIVLSGILSEQADEMSALYAQWFDMGVPAVEEHWVRLSGVRK